MKTSLSQIDLKNVSIAAASKIICQQFNTTMKAGEIWGILGPNGCGKSTLLHSMANLHPLIAGQIKFDGIDASKNKIAKHVGILLQEMNTLFAQTVLDYCIGARFPHLSFLQKLSSVDVAIIEKTLRFLGLWEIRTQALPSLSGGEKRRTAIASLLIQSPDVYLLDEPTNHLDLKYQSLLFHHLGELARQDNAIVVMALHDINQAQRYCDHMILMFPDGQLLAGNKQLVLTVENLSALFQQEVMCLAWQDALFWKTVS